MVMSGGPHGGSHISSSIGSLICFSSGFLLENSPLPRDLWENTGPLCETFLCSSCPDLGHQSWARSVGMREAGKGVTLQWMWCLCFPFSLFNKFPYFLSSANRSHDSGHSWRPTAQAWSVRPLLLTAVSGSDMGLKQDTPSPFPGTDP